MITHWTEATCGDCAVCWNRTARKHFAPDFELIAMKVMEGRHGRGEAAQPCLTSRSHWTGTGTGRDGCIFYNVPLGQTTLSVVSEPFGALTPVRTACRTLIGYFVSEPFGTMDSPAALFLEIEMGVFDAVGHRSGGAGTGIYLTVAKTSRSLCAFVLCAVFLAPDQPTEVATPTGVGPAKMPSLPFKCPGSYRGSHWMCPINA